MAKITNIATVDDGHFKGMVSWVSTRRELHYVPDKHQSYQLIDLNTLLGWEKAHRVEWLVERDAWIEKTYMNPPTFDWFAIFIGIVGTLALFGVLLVLYGVYLGIMGG